MKKALALIALCAVSHMTRASEFTSQFKISATMVYEANNMMFRVYGMPAMSSCPGNAWAYINEDDSGAKTKISTLLSAAAAGKTVVLDVAPVNFYNNGAYYCQIYSVTVLY